MLNVTLRKATAEDSEFVFCVKKAALGEYIEQTWGWDEDFQRRFHNDDYEPARTKIIVANGSDAGWMLIAESDAEIQLQEIYLHPNHQRKGIGSHLIGLLLTKADAEQKPVKLSVLKVNQRARLLYERLGFLRCGETETHDLMSRLPG